MTGMQALQALEADFSAWHSICNSLRSQDRGDDDSRLPAEPLGPRDEEDREGVRALLKFARSVGKPVLVGFRSDPSKAFEERLRSAAKPDRIHFYRLVYGQAILELRNVPGRTDASSDEAFLKGLGISMP